MGTGPGFITDTVAYDVELGHSGNLLAIVVGASNSSSGAILSIDPSTGNRTLLSGLGLGTGPDLPPTDAGALGVATDGTMYTNYFGSGSFTFQGPVLRIDPATGNRTIVSDATHGTGPLFAPTPALMVVPNVPEPSTIVLGAMGVAMLLVRRWRRIASLAVALVPVLAPLVASAQVTMAWSYVGNPNNAADPLTGHGAVDHSYNIGTYDVTNSQYVTFLNSNDPTGANTLGLYNSGMSNADLVGGIDYNSGAGNGSKYSVISGDDNHPVTYVTWYDAVRFANWLNNGQVPGSTETGAYTILGGTPMPSNGLSITRNAGATVFLASENEWYKAAYYNPATSSYFLYPTSSNTAPKAVPPIATPNSANYNFAAGGVTDVGAYTGTTSPYGAFDMGGNELQWTESLIGGSSRVARSGAFNAPSDGLKSLAQVPGNPAFGLFTYGFRVASIPEPSTIVLAAFGGLALLAYRRRRA